MHRIENKFEVSVIIPTYNRSQLLYYSLMSLKNQDIDKDRFEVIVADDGSSDDTMEVVKGYERDINIRYVYQPDKGYRPGSARNMGVQVAKGHICLFIDSGVLLNSDCIRQHIAFYSGTSGRLAVVGYVYGFERTKDSEAKLVELVDPADAARSISKISDDEIFFDIREEHYVRYNYQIHDLPAPWYYFWTCHVSAPRTELMSVGLFDEAFDGRWGGEDNDLAFRLIQHGVKMHLLRAAEAIHYPHEKNKAERRQEGYQNAMYFDSKFRTTETRLFVDYYMDHLEFVDINKISLDMRTANESMTSEPLYKENMLLTKEG